MGLFLMSKKIGKLSIDESYFKSDHYSFKTKH